MLVLGQNQGCNGIILKIHSSYNMKINNSSSFSEHELTKVDVM